MKTACRDFFVWFGGVLVLPFIVAPVGAVEELKREAPVEVFCNGRSETQSVSLAPIDEVAFPVIYGEASCICTDKGPEVLKSAVQVWAEGAVDPSQDTAAAVEQCADFSALLDAFDQEHFDTYAVDPGSQQEIVISCYTEETIRQYCVSVRDVPRTESESVSD